MTGNKIRSVGTVISGAALEEVACRMFARNAADYADPALVDLAWLDPGIREFWIEQAAAVLHDVDGLATFRNQSTTRHR